MPEGEKRLTNEEVRKKRNELFTQEKERQAALITRVEKIEVKCLGPMEQCTLMMNKGLSTPLDCARHIHENIVQRAAIAEVNGRSWDMCRPLSEDCELTFQFYKDENPHFANKAFWRTCSFLLGYIADRAFKDQFYVQLHSWPKPHVNSGSFVHNVGLDIENWQPRLDELRVLSRIGKKVIIAGNRFEQLEVDASLALKMFEDNKYKVEQIPDIASSSPTGSTVTLYRLLDHVDISSGPMVGCLDQIGPFRVVAVHPIDTSVGLLYRFQGIAIPRDFTMSSFAFDVCCERARKMNYSGLPRMLSDKDGDTSEESDNEAVAAEEAVRIQLEPSASAQST